MSEVLTISSLIEFLLDLLRDEEAMAEFERDPQAVLAQHGLGGITAEDLRDVRPLMVDQGYLCHSDDDDDDHDGGAGGGGGHHRRDRDDESGSAGGGSHHRDDRDHQDGGHHDRDDDVVNEITIIKNEIVVENVTNVENNHYHDYGPDFHVDGDGNTIVYEDNDQVDNKGGAIDDSNVVVGDGNAVGNSDDDVLVDDSFDDNRDQSDDDGTDIDDSNVGNQDNDVDNSVDDSFDDNDLSTDVDNSINGSEVTTTTATGSGSSEGLGESYGAAESTDGTTTEPAADAALV